MGENLATVKKTKKTGAEEKFLQEQEKRVKELIAKKEDYLKLLEGENDHENRQIAEKTKTEIAELSKALVRIEHKTYGFCKGFGNKIPSERLKAFPLATNCTECNKCASKN
ncbi:MAG: hypothetical protein WCJ57_02160 [Candidatus Falkowbacteria bacterium]